MAGEDGRSKIVGQMTSFDVIWGHIQQKWHHFAEKTQRYLVNVD